MLSPSAGIRVGVVWLRVVRLGAVRPVVRTCNGVVWLCSSRSGCWRLRKGLWKSLWRVLVQLLVRDSVERCDAIMIWLLLTLM